MTPNTGQTQSKLSLPQFLKILTSNGVAVSKAMMVAGKIYKDYNTPSKVTELSDVKLSAAGISDKEDRKLVLDAFRKAGYVYKRKTITKQEAVKKNIASGSSSLSSPSATSSSKRKRKNEYLPDGSPDEAVGPAGFEFNEILDEKILSHKACVINRAPVTMAWAMVVAERLGFKREESLSIASLYAEMNAVSKGISLGLFNEERRRNMDRSPTGSQPYVELMGRNPLYQTQEGQWRALSGGSPVFPGAAFSYISRSFRQTTPFIIGALQLLALSYPPNELNSKGWTLYVEFRPQADGWGKRSEIKCGRILDLRRKETIASTVLEEGSFQGVQPVIKVEATVDNLLVAEESGEPRAKKRVIAEGDSETVL